MEEKNEELKEETKTKKSFLNNKKTVKGKALTAWIIVIIIIAMIVTFGSGLIVGKLLYEGKKKNSNTVIDNTNTETNTNSEVDNNENLEFNDNAKSQIDDFIKLAMHSSYEGTTIANDLSNGLVGLTVEQKELLTYFSVDDLKVLLTADMVPEKYKNDPYWNVSSGSTKIYQLPIQTFKDEYKRLFKEEYTIKGEDYHFGACPFIFKIDLELGNMYYSNQCGGTGLFGYLYSNYKYESDRDHYYVYQYVTYYGENNEKHIIEFNKVKSKELVLSIALDKTNEIESTFEENKTKFETIKWTFDKDFNFISTENLG